MPARDPRRQQLVSRIASLKYWRPDDPNLPQLRTELITLKLIEAISTAYSSAPPLDAEQRARITRAVYANLGSGR